MKVGVRGEKSRDGRGGRMRKEKARVRILI